MTHRYDDALPWRFIDKVVVPVVSVLLTAIVLLAGYEWSAAAKVQHWDAIAIVVENEKTGVVAADRRLILLEDHDRARMQDHQLLVDIAKAVGVRSARIADRP